MGSAAHPHPQSLPPILTPNPQSWQAGKEDVLDAARALVSAVSAADAVDAAGATGAADATDAAGAARAADSADGADLEIVSAEAKPRHPPRWPALSQRRHPWY